MVMANLVRNVVRRPLQDLIGDSDGNVSSTDYALDFADDDGNLQLPYGFNGATSFRIKFDFLSTDSTCFIVCGRDASSDGPLVWMASGKIRAVINSNTLESAAAYNDGVWHTVEVTWDGSTMTLDVDGTENSKANTETVSVSTDIRVGQNAYASANTLNFVGALDNLEIDKNGVALGDYRLNEGEGTVAGNALLGGQDGTITNTDWIVKNS